MASKRVRLVVVFACVTVVAAAALVGWRFFVQSHEGYFSPVFSPDRRSVYFIERRTRGLVWGLGLEHFTPPAHAFVLDDRIAIKRLHRDSGRVETLARWPPSPLVRKHIRTYRNRIFGVLSTRLQFRDDGLLHYSAGISIPRVPRSERWTISGAAQPESIPRPSHWSEHDVRLTGHARFVLDGDWELIHFFGEAAYPPAIVAYNERTAEIRILRKGPAFDAQFPEGIPRRVLADHSVRAAVERLDALHAARNRLLSEFIQQGMSEGEALLRTSDALAELGFYPKPATLTAHAVDRAPPDGTVFSISAREFQVGLFQDIEQAIRNPGSAVKHSTGTYVRHRDFETSEKLKQFLDTGATRFYLLTENGIFEVRITPSQPAER